MNTRPVDLLDTSVKPDPFKPVIGDVYYSHADNSRAVVYAIGAGHVSVIQNGIDAPEGMAFRYFRLWLVSRNMVPCGKVREGAAQ